MQAKLLQFYKIGHWVVFIKTRTETCIKGWDWTCRLRSLRGGPILRARGRGMGPRSPAHSTAHWRALLRSLRGLQRTQTSTQSIQKTKIYHWARIGNTYDMGYGVIFLGGSLMAWLRLSYERRGKVSGWSEFIWCIKWKVAQRFRG